VKRVEQVTGRLWWAEERLPQREVVERVPLEQHQPDRDVDFLDDYSEKSVVGSLLASEVG